MISEHKISDKILCCRFSHSFKCLHKHKHHNMKIYKGMEVKHTCMHRHTVLTSTWDKSEHIGKELLIPTGWGISRSGHGHEEKSLGSCQEYFLIGDNLLSFKLLNVTHLKYEEWITNLTHSLLLLMPKVLYSFYGLWPCQC